MAEYSPTAIANEFIVLGIENGANDMSPMKVQKLVYLAHGWYLANFEEPLIDSQVQAWNFGPVIPDLYHDLKQFGSKNVAELVEPEYIRGFDGPENHPRVDSDDLRTMDFIRKVYGVYSRYTPVQLSNLTHKSDTPWSKVTNGGEKIGRSRAIPNDLIKKCFISYLEDSKA